MIDPTRRWREFTCCDCDPAHNTGDEDDSPYENAYIVLLPLDETTDRQGQSAPDFLDTCPRCGSYLSMCDGMVYTLQSTFVRGGLRL